MFLTSLDIFIIAAYAVILFALAQYVSREPKGAHKNTEDYFLAGKSLPWWAIGASLIAANISAEQIIGMSGDGYKIGLAIAAYEWQATIVLILVAKFLLPIFLKREIYTMPQFLETRYGEGIKISMSLFWIVLYTIVNLTAVMWLGSIAVNTLTNISLFWGMAGLAAFALAYSMFGGLKAVALTDMLQVTVLVAGGIAIAWITMGMIGGDMGVLGGFERLYTEFPGKFHMILEESHAAYGKLPGIWTILGGLWVLHFSYWGFNQYIIQRALGAKNVSEAQKGLVFAAALKLLMPLIIVLPGIAAVMLVAPEMAVIDKNILDTVSDRAYPEVMKIMPSGLRGLIFAALIAAIVSSLASMVNSISTIFTMDIYRDYLIKDKSEEHYVMIGRITAVAAMVIALLTAKPLLGDMEGAFQKIQEYSGFIAPGIVAVFLMGMFYRRTNSYGAFTMLFFSIIGSIIFKVVFPSFPFVNRIWVVFLTCLLFGTLASHLTSKPKKGHPITLGDINFKTTKSFNLWAITVCALLIMLYIFFW